MPGGGGLGGWGAAGGRESWGESELGGEGAAGGGACILRFPQPPLSTPTYRAPLLGRTDLPCPLLERTDLPCPILERTDLPRPLLERTDLLAHAAHTLLANRAPSLSACPLLGRTDLPCPLLEQGHVPPGWWLHLDHNVLLERSQPVHQLRTSLSICIILYTCTHGGGGQQHGGGQRQGCVWRGHTTSLSIRSVLSRRGGGSIWGKGPAS